MSFWDFDERIRAYNQIITFHSNEEKECAKKGEIEWRDYHLMKRDETIRFKRILEEQEEPKEKKVKVEVDNTRFYSNILTNSRLILILIFNHSIQILDFSYKFLDFFRLFVVFWVFL